MMWDGGPNTELLQASHEPAALCIFSHSRVCMNRDMVAADLLQLQTRDMTKYLGKILSITPHFTLKIGKK